MNKSLVNFYQTPAGNLYAYLALSNEILSLKTDLEYPLHQSSLDALYDTLQAQGYVRQSAFSGVDWSCTFEEYKRKSECEIPTLVLEMTRKCNLNCAYCAVSGALYHRQILPADMSEQTVFRSIDFFSAHNRDCASADIRFYGGEALLRFELIRRAVDYAQKSICEKPLMFDISTNGLLLSDAVCNWLAEHPNVMVTCTVNGPFHDTYRKTRIGEASLTPILSNLSNLRTKYPHVWERQVKLLANIERERDIFALLDFYQVHFDRPPGMVTTIDWDDGISKIRMPDAANTFTLPLQVDFTKTGVVRDYFESTLLSLHKRPVDLTAMRALISSCFPCEVKLLVQTDGSLSYCEKFCNRTRIGTLQDGLDFKKMWCIYDSARLLYQNKCQTCWAQRLCQVCLAMVTTQSGEVAKEIPEQLCAASRRNIEQSLILYCKLAEEAPQRLQHLVWKTT